MTLSGTLAIAIITSVLTFLYGQFNINKQSKIDKEKESLRYQRDIEKEQLQYQRDREKESLLYQREIEKENRQHEKDKNKEQYHRMEALYQDVLTALDQVVRYTQMGKYGENLVEEYPALMSRLNLAAPKEIQSQFLLTSGYLHEWEWNYWRGVHNDKLPEGKRVTPEYQQFHAQEAAKIVPDVFTGIAELTDQMIAHLKTLEP